MSSPAYLPQAPLSAIENEMMDWGPPPPPPDISLGAYDPEKHLALAPPQFRRAKDGVRVKLKPKALRALSARFRSKLARVTLPALELPQPSESPSPTQEWDHWEAIARAWAAQACFLPGDPEFWDLGMETEHCDLEYVGRLVVFGVARKQDSEGLEWLLQRDPIDAQYPITEKRSCPCIFLRVPRGAVDWDELRALALSPGGNNRELSIPPQLRGTAAAQWETLEARMPWKADNRPPATPLQHLLHLIAIRSHACQCPYAVLSDGEMSFFAEMKLKVKDDALSAAKFSGELVPEAACPAMYLLLAAIADLAPSLAEKPVRTLGALDCCMPAVCSDFQGLRQDFDAYHLGRDPAYYARFLGAKMRAHVLAAITLPSRGDVLSLHRTEPLPRKLLPWRCYGGYAPVSLPDDVAQSVCRTPCRPRRPILLKHTPDTAPLAFAVTARLTEGWEAYFHVYVGRLEGARGLLCVKVFDERLFPLDIPDPKEVGKRPELLVDAVQSMRHAESLLRAEEAAYVRLAEYQGSLVPHFYGCVEVELSGGFMALGILTEYVEGVAIDRLINAVHSSWTHEEQVKFYSRVRRALKVLKACRICDQDKPSIRFLCVPRLDPEAADRADAVDLVMNNFAFTKQPWAPAHLLPGSEDVRGLADMLHLSDEMKAETGWLREHRKRYEF